MAVAVMGRRHPRRRRPGVSERTENGTAGVRVTWPDSQPYRATSAASAPYVIRLDTTKEEA